MKGYPKWFTVRLITIFVFALFLSGALLLPTALEMRFERTVAWRLGGDARILTAAAHAALAFLAMGLLGALGPLHIRSGWRRRKSLVSGLAQVGFFGGLFLSGLLLYYVSSTGWLATSSAVHTLLGVALLLVYLAHAYWLGARN